MSDGAGGDPPADAATGSTPTPDGATVTGAEEPPTPDLAEARRESRLRRLLGVLLVALLLAGFVAVVGPRRVAAELAGADPRWLVAGAVATLGSLALWSEAQRALFVAAGADAPPGRFLLGYLSGNFAKRTVPGARLGAPAVMAYALCRETGFSYDRGLTAVTVGYLVGFPAAVVVPLAALPLVAGTETGGTGPVLLGVLLASVVLALGVGTLVAARPGPAVRLAHALAAAGRATVGRLSDRVAAALAADRVDRAVAAVGETVAVIGRSRTALATTFLLTVAGWVTIALSLSAALLAFGHPAALAVAVLAVPLSTFGALVPLPGGLGGVDATLGTVLVAALGFDLVAAGVVVLAYRLLHDGVIVLVGGLVTATRAATGDDPAV